MPQSCIARTSSLTKEAASLWTRSRDLCSGICERRRGSAGTCARMLKEPNDAALVYGSNPDL